MENIGFILSEGIEGWNGGINYYNNLFQILIDSKKYKPIIFTSKKSEVILKNKFSSEVKIYSYKFLTKGNLLYYIWKFILYNFGYSIFLDSILLKRNIILVSHNIYVPLNRRSIIPSCAWIPDIQSLHYPGFFSKRAIRSQNYLFKKIGENSTKILFSSEDSKNDYLQLFPKCDNSKLGVFHFVVKPNKMLPEFTENILEKYNLTKFKYFLITNQFWKHKNHIEVIEAINIIKKEYNILPFKIVATGLLNDPRDLESSKVLLSKIKEYSLEKDFITTGVIPYFDVLCLQNYSLSVIQPSLFEGWNTAVEECKNIGKKIILSDIPVHVEQDPKNVVYFTPGKINTLVDAIKKVYNNFDFQIENNYMKEALSSQDTKWNIFSKNYLNLIEEIKSKRSK